jgi:hypothetical protein
MPGANGLPVEVSLHASDRHLFLRCRAHCELALYLRRPSGPQLAHSEAHATPCTAAVPLLVVLLCARQQHPF